MFGRGGGGRKPAKRFSLLLLEEEEDYVQDWVGTCRWPANVGGSWQGPGAELPGRVRLCNRSLFFEPDDVRVPIVRLPFATTQALDAGGTSLFWLTTTSVTKMKANMEEVPYAFEKGQPSRWGLALSYAPLAAVLPLVTRLLEYNRRPKPERSRLLEAFVREREDDAGFDPSRMVDFCERLVRTAPATLLSPLVRERGRLAVSDARVYFQPLHNVSGDTPVRSHPLSGVAAVARRRAGLRPLGLELFFVMADGSSGGNAPLQGPLWDGPSAFFAFRSEDEREAVAAALTSSLQLGSALPRPPGPAGDTLVGAHGLLLEAQGGWLMRVTAAWQHARVSNFDYLLYLNLAAGRSFNDLAQWPVFPWVLSNWVSEKLDLEDVANYRDLSKPVGALNPARLEEFRKRYREMPSDSFDEAGGTPPFLYGTHYSTPGYVMYWLLRAAPAHMLRLQNGRFDAPDRLFASVRESWESVNTSSTDVKELIPEFYLPGGDWLVNAQRLPLGVRQSGAPVGDVELPPWAPAGPEDFLARHRAALEAPPVSRALPAWIDLVFGCKQRGEAAVEADNVFYHLTYEGAVDVEAVSDPVELKALETQINEFGQTPAQLFHHPHPPRLVIPPAPDPATVFAPYHASGAVGPAAGATSAAAVMAGRASPAIVGGRGALGRSSFGIGAAGAGGLPSGLSSPLRAPSRGPPPGPGLDLGGYGGYSSSGPGSTGAVQGAGGQQGGDSGGHIRALTLGLISTLLEAAAPEYASPSTSPAKGPAGDADSGVAAGGAAAGTGMGRQGGEQATAAGLGAGAASSSGTGSQEPGAAVSGAGTAGGSLAAGAAGGASPAGAPTAGEVQAGPGPGPGSSGGSGGVFGGLLKMSRFLGDAVVTATAGAGAAVTAVTAATAGGGGLLARASSGAGAGASAGVSRPGSTGPSAGDAAATATAADDGGGAAGLAPPAAATPEEAAAAAPASSSVQGQQPGAATAPKADPAAGAGGLASRVGEHLPPPLRIPPPAVSHASKGGAEGAATGQPKGAASSLPSSAALSRATTPGPSLSSPQALRSWSAGGLPARLHGHASTPGSGWGLHASTVEVLPGAREGLSGVALWRPSAQASLTAHVVYLYAVGSAGALRVLAVPTGSLSAASSARQSPAPVTAAGVTASTPLAITAGTPQLLRSLQLEGDALCMAPVHGLRTGASASAVATTAVTPTITAGLACGQSHPLLLTGCHNRKVHAYCVERGSLLGSWDAHDDAVCCLALAPPAGSTTATGGGPWGYGSTWGSEVAAGPPSRALTASWDCSVKVWSLAEGRHPWAWSSLPPSPEVTLSDFDAGVWALSAGPEGSHAVCAGTEEGLVGCWDLRSGRSAWRARLAQDYIGGVALTPCGRFCVAGAADGRMALLDRRRAGAVLASTGGDAPIRCVLTDGTLALAGDEEGALRLWDVGLLSATSQSHCGGPLAPAPDGTYPLWWPSEQLSSGTGNSFGNSGVGFSTGAGSGQGPAAAVTAVAVTGCCESPAERPAVDLGVAREDGSVTLLLEL